MNEKILKFLMEIKENVMKENINLAIEQIDEIAEELRIKINWSQITNPTKKKAYKKAEAYLKKQRKKNAAVFGVASRQKVNDEEYICLPGKTTVFFLTEDCGLPILEDMTKEEREKYGIHEKEKAIPFSNIVPKKCDCKEIEMMTYEELVKEMKMHPENVKKGNSEKRYIINLPYSKGDGSVYCNGFLLKECFEILGVEELKAYSKNEVSVIVLETENGDFALLLPIKVKKEKGENND